MTITETLPGTGPKPAGVCDCCEHEPDGPLVETVVHVVDDHERTEGDTSVSLCDDCVNAGVLYPPRLNRAGYGHCEWRIV